MVHRKISAIVEKNDLWIADRNFATLELMFDIASNGAFFLMRQHVRFKTWTEENDEKYVG